MTTTNALANAFRTEARRALTPAEIDEINRRNTAAGPDAGWCASHDFYDANMLMLDAFNATFGREPHITSDADFEAINAAWSAVRATGF